MCVCSLTVHQFFCFGLIVERTLGTPLESRDYSRQDVMKGALDGIVYSTL